MIYVVITSNYGPDCRAGMCPLYPLHLALLYLCLALPLLVAVVDGSLATWQLAFSRNQVSDSPHSVPECGFEGLK